MKQYIKIGAAVLILLIGVAVWLIEFILPFVLLKWAL
ncbi:hypothetical protein [Enterococcus phage 47]|nr:hypothetical protein [Enterococcus phage 47]